MSRPIKCFIDNIIPPQYQWKLELFILWDKIIGHMKSKVSIEKIDNDILYLNVSHPAWAQELHLLSPLLKKKINAHFDEPKITAIRFHNRAPGTIKKFYKKKLLQQQIFAQQPGRLTDEENSILAPLQSDQLQSVIAAYFIRCKTFKKT